jgi:hypothetical protein
MAVHAYFAQQNTYLAVFAIVGRFQKTSLPESFYMVILQCEFKQTLLPDSSWPLAAQYKPITAAV